VGYVAAPELSSRRGEAGPRGSVGAQLNREARSRAEEYVAASELSSRGDRARSHETCDSAGAQLSKDVRSGAAEHVAALEPTSTGRYDPKIQLT
jgi:hypothetical protein